MSALAYRHQRVQRLRRLVGRRSAREEERCFVIEGLNLLEEALRAGAPVEAVFVDRLGGSTTAGTDDRLQGLLDRCFAAGARVFELEDGVLSRVAGTVTPQPVMAIVPVPAWSMAGVRALGPKLVILCADVRDPGNIGTVVRSAWAAGADAVVCCQGTVDIWNPKAVRSSAGAVFHLPVVTAGAPAPALDEVGRWGLHRLGAFSEGGEDYTQADLAQPCALVLGNEAAGLSLTELAPYLDGAVSIPMPGGAESLNVGVAAAVLCFEAARQRRLARDHGRTVGAVQRTSPGPAEGTWSGTKRGGGKGPLLAAGAP